jgi:uncharacterized damage-inducible protein DinB
MHKPSLKMNEVERIADQLRRAFEGEAWHGPAVLELLKDVNAAKAAAKPANGGHSIWEIVNHIGAWDGAVRRRIGGEAVELEGDLNFPPVGEASEGAWKKAVQNLKDGHAALIQAVLAMPEHRLLESVPGREHYDYYHMLHGVVQHELYHAGQIALLKKTQPAS